MNDKLEIVSKYIYYKLKSNKDKEKLKKYQEKKLKKHLKFVCSNTPFYKSYTGKKIEDFPIMNKEKMMDNFDNLNTVNVKKEEALEFAIEAEKTREFSPKLKNITVGLSSGTSNKRGVFLISNKEKSQWAGYILARVLPKNILKKRKIAFFMRANSNLYESIGSNTIQFNFFDIYKPMEENIKKLKELNADILIGQPSVLLEICDYFEKTSEKLSFEKVISIAEVLEKNDENKLKKFFGLEKIDQVYQCTEGCLASTCEYGTIHLHEDIVHIEKEYLDEKRFIPIVTDFMRSSQPIIRYRLNDILVESKEKCKCGSCFTSLEKIEGREDDVFIFKNTEGKTIKIFPDFIRRCILFAGDINNYRVLQKEDGNIEIYTENLNDVKEAIKKEFENLANDRKIILPKITFLEYQYDKKRKLKRVESLYKD